MIALDTNVLVYACDKADPARQQTALDLIWNTKGGVLLWQVTCEFIAASRKLEPPRIYFNRRLVSTGGFSGDVRAGDCCREQSS